MSTHTQDYESVACQLLALGYRRGLPISSLMAEVPLLPRGSTNVYIHMAESWYPTRIIDDGPACYLWLPRRKRWLPCFGLYFTRSHPGSRTARIQLPSETEAPVLWPTGKEWRP